MFPHLPRSGLGSVCSFPALHSVHLSCLSPGWVHPKAGGAGGSHQRGPLALAGSVWLPAGCHGSLVLLAAPAASGECGRVIPWGLSHGRSCCDSGSSGGAGWKPRGHCHVQSPLCPGGCPCSAWLQPQLGSAVLQWLSQLILGVSHAEHISSTAVWQPWSLAGCSAKKLGCACRISQPRWAQSSAAARWGLESRTQHLELNCFLLGNHCWFSLQPSLVLVSS